MNPTAATLLGIEPPRETRVFADLVHAFEIAPHGSTGAFDVVDCVITTGQPSPVLRCRRRTPADADVWVDLSATPAPLISGQAPGVLVSLVDVSRQVAVDRRRQDRQRLLESTLQAMHEGVIVQTRTGEIVQCNAAAERIIGLSADQLSGCTSLDARWQATHEDGSPFPRDQHPAAVALRTGQPQRAVRMWVHRPDGSRALVALTAVPLWDGRPEPYAVVATFADVTAAHEAERRMQAVLAQVADLFDNAPCGYHAIGPDGTFTEINDTELQWLGVSREDVIGKCGLVDFLTPEGLAAFDGVFPRLVSGESQGFQVEVDLLGRHGPPRRVLARGSVQRDARGAFTRTRTILVDVTELRRAQHHLVDAERMEALGRLTGGVAHAFNNMLTAIVGTAELALEGTPEHAAVRSDLATIIEAARRGADLVGHLVTYARQQVTAPVEVVVSEAIDAIVRTAGAAAGPGMAITAEHRQHAVIRMDRRALEQAVSRLLDNAVEASGGAGSIVVETGVRELAAERSRPSVPPGVYAYVSVRDAGVGMPPEVLARATEPFFTTKAFGRNTGLGLSIAHGVAAQAGGGLMLASEIGRGTTVTMVVPLAEPPSAPPG